jgi:hypothetical protein
MRWLQVLVLALVVTVALNVPAFGGTSIASKVASLTKRTKKLERRVNALAALEIGHGVHVDQVVVPAGGGGTQGSAFCSPGKVVGGGAAWGQPYPTDHIITSRPDASIGWFVQMGPHPAGDLLTIYAICVDV